MEVPSDRRYTSEHEWVLATEDGKYRIGKGPCIYKSKASAEKAYRGYRASKTGHSGYKASK